jgi:hypothetical protein
MLGGKPPTFTRQFAQSFGVNRFSTGMVEVDRAKTGELLNDSHQRAMSRRAGRLACPGQHAHGGILFWSQQRIKSIVLISGQICRELTSDVPFRNHQHSCDQALDNR